MSKYDMCTVLVVIIVGSALMLGLFSLMQMMFEMGRIIGCGGAE